MLGAGSGYEAGTKFGSVSSVKVTMTKRFIAAEAFECELNRRLEAICEMKNDDVTVPEVKETILNGTRVQNARGPGYIYTYEAISVVADEEPCHYYIITVWKTTGEQTSYKNKPYRRRRYMRRKEWKRKKGKRCYRCGKANLERGDYPLELSGEHYGDFEGYGCPNCGLVFYTEAASSEIEALLEKYDGPILRPRELCLLLLYATDEPIRGAVSFMKEVFLLFQEKLREFDVMALSPHFISYHYGPYSFDIVESWYELEEDGFMATKGRMSTRKETFFLTKEGEAAAARIWESLPPALREELPSWRRGLDELGNDGILKDVYEKYPEYTDRSKVRERVLPRGVHGRA